MDLRRGLPHEYGRSRGGDGGGYGAHPSSSDRAIPPTAVPSLSTGQGFYTVESLQGATMVPPPQPARPPPRLLPLREPYARDLPPARFHPAERGDFGPFERRYPPPPAVGRKMMMMPPPDLPFSRRGEVLRGPGMLHHHPPHPPPFMGDPRMPGFATGRREPPLHNAWGPGDDDRHAYEHRRDRSRPVQRFKAKKEGQNTDRPASQVKSPSKGAAADKKPSADKKNSVEGGLGWCAVCKIDCGKGDSLKMHIAGKRHKKQVESQMQVDKPSDKTEEAKEEGGAIASASEEAAGKMNDNKDNEQGATIAVNEGEMDDKSGEAMVVDAPKGEGKSEISAPKPIAGKKRALKDAVTPKKKTPKSVASSDATKATTATAAKGAEEVTNASNVLKASDQCAPDAHAKGADNESSEVSSVFSNLKGDGNEPPASERKPGEENIKEGEDGSKEVRDSSDLENGRAGQSAEIQ